MKKFKTIFNKQKFNIFFIIFIFFFIFLIHKNKQKQLLHEQYSNNKIIFETPTKNNPQIIYKICDDTKLTRPLRTILDKHNSFQVENTSKLNNWNLYLPCGYNYVETELKDIIISNSEQKIYAIKGCDKIASKNELWKIVCDFYGRDYASKLIPESYIINNPKDIALFKKNFNSNNVYFLKKNIQRKEGIMISNNYNKIINNISNTKKDLEDYYRTSYCLYNKNNKNNKKNIRNTTDEESFNKNSKINTLPINYKIIQKGVNNLFLLKKRKINLRLYLLIQCKNNKKQFYLYNKGKCIYTQKDINSNINGINDKIDNEQYLTSYNLDPSIYKTNPESINELSKYLNLNELWANIIKLFQEITTAIENKICKSKKLENNLTFQLFGADVIFDKNLHPYLLELNKGPSMKFITETDKVMKLKLLEDVFGNVGLLKNINNNNNNNFIKINPNKNI